MAVIDARKISRTFFYQKPSLFVHSGNPTITVVANVPTFANLVLLVTNSQHAASVWALSVAKHDQTVKHIAVETRTNTDMEMVCQLEAITPRRIKERGKTQNDGATQKNN